MYQYTFSLCNFINDCLHFNAPVGIEGGDGGSATRVHRLCLLQQDRLDQAADVHVDVAGEAVQGGRIDSESGQEV